MEHKIIQKYSLTQKETNSLNDLPQHGNFPKLLLPILNNHLDKDDVMPIRILFILILNLKKIQIQKKDLILEFNKDWAEMNSDYLLQVSGSFTDFLPEGSKNQTLIKDALIKLSDIKLHITKGDVTIDAPLISNLIVIKKKGFKFAINYFWIERLINITNYILFDKESILNINSAYAMKMYVFLLSFPYIKISDPIFKDIIIQSSIVRGGRVRLETIKELLNIPDDMPLSRIKKRKLDPIRVLLNQKANTSFNYKIEKGNFVFVTYETNNLIAEKNNTVLINKYMRVIEHRIKKHKLNVDQSLIFAGTLVRYDLELMQKTLARKTEILNLYGEEFITAFGELKDHAITSAKLKDVNYESTLDTSDRSKIIRKLTKKITLKNVQN